ncbi:MAG: KH domain-containing protein [Desulfofustis sp.]|nr:KH domain-containing protein [Desulfofustis sp.]MBT8354923.1 KH domain-containing protein [Desulfofustis sp.]RZW26918.1 MAG: KH domain-containing protein [Desulfobulbaceae bacterium]
MKTLVEHIAEALVDKPDQVNVVESENGDMINLELTVAQEDLGKVIGKQGRTARAMRSILSAAAARDNKKSRLDILE